jgi:hypothetical protein
MDDTMKVYRVERGSDFIHLLSGKGTEWIEFTDGEIFWIFKNGVIDSRHIPVIPGETI